MINKYKYIITISIISSLIIIFTFTGITNKLLSIFSSVSFGKATNIDDKLSQEQLEAKVISLEAEVASLLYLKSENELLKSAIQTKNETGITPIQVKIIAFDNDFTRSSALVEVGSNDGVKINQPVIYLGHLVGKVKEVSDSYSTIQFLNDTELKLAVTIQNSSSSQGVLKSEFGTVLEVDAVSKLESVSVENNIITLANENIPAGLLVGKVKLVTEGDLFHKIIVDSPIDFYKLTDVFILKT